MAKGKQKILFIYFLDLYFEKKNLQLPDDSVEASKQAISMTVNSSASGLAYLWETTPVLGMEALPIYGFGHNGDYKLPGAPWCYDLLH